MHSKAIHWEIFVLVGRTIDKKANTEAGEKGEGRAEEAGKTNGQSNHSFSQTPFLHPEGISASLFSKLEN